MEGKGNPMKRMMTGLAIGLAAAMQAEPAVARTPLIVKKGTIDLDLCETTPFVFKGKLYRLDWERPAPKDFMTGSGRLRIVDHDTQRVVSRFGEKQRFPCAYAEGDTVYVVGVNESAQWCGDTLTLFTSKDLVNWESRTIFSDARFRICNTSLCKAPGGYMISFEVHQGSPGGIGYFSGRFLASKDLIDWTLLPEEQRITLNGKAISPHCLRFCDGWYYVFSTVGDYPTGWVLLLHRSRDLKAWEPCPGNPVMIAQEADKQIANPLLSEEQREKIAKAQNRNNSDIDFCEYKGRLIINYSWGNQVGTEFIAEAEYAGNEPGFLQSWFPASTSER